MLIYFQKSGNNMNSLSGYKYEVEMMTPKLHLSYEEVFISDLNLIVDDTGSIRQSNSLSVDLSKCTVIDISDAAIEKINILAKNQLETFQKRKIERELRGFLFADSQHSIADSRFDKQERDFINRKEAENALYKTKLDDLAVKIRESFS